MKLGGSSDGESVATDMGNVVRELEDQHTALTYEPAHGAPPPPTTEKRAPPSTAHGLKRERYARRLQSGR